MGRSQRIRLREVRALLRLQAELGELPPLSAAWKQRAIDGILDLIPAKAVVFCRWGNFRAGATPTMRDAAMSGWIEPEGQQAIAEFLQRPDMIDAHPFMKALLAVRDTCHTHRRVDLVDDREWYRSEVLNTSFRVCDVDDNMTSVYRHEPTSTGYGFGLQRARSDRKFTRRGRVMLHLIQEAVLPGFKRQAAIEARTTCGLSPRLQQTLDRLLAGESEKQIARRMHRSPHTIHDYVKALYKHFNVSTRAELIIACLDPARRAGADDQPAAANGEQRSNPVD